ncbi:DUF998 domain-containing protein [Acidianus manzaensis]|uniref:DUF998 domain-containing protein n=1 Tax=Acidianus manzaensis TaxID=282676 RepID=A0A1W6JWL3_9CREN|nr:DUF998 domain-containing protein [Acidianus manzaensis]ARM74671.1 hypothetical protein B6F84_00605 [Acidianus manzaensis]
MDRSKISGYLILVGVSQFILFIIVAEALYPGYSIRSNYVSDLGVGSTAIIFNGSIIFMGLLIIVSSILLWRSYSFLIFITGVGAMFVGIFPETTGYPHLISALIAFLFGGISAIVTSFHRNYFWSILGIITLVSLVLFILKIYPIGPGGTERLIIYPELIWGISFATYLIEGRKH